MNEWIGRIGPVRRPPLPCDPTPADGPTVQAARPNDDCWLYALVEAMPQIAFLAAPDGRILFQNRRWSDYSGAAPDACWIAALHPDDRNSTGSAWSNALRSGANFEAEHRLRGSEGGYRWFLTRASAQRASPDAPVLRWLGTSTDITALVLAREVATQRLEHLESRLIERTRALSDAAEELGAEMRRREAAQSALLQSQKLEALGHLTASVSHDFNNILNAILGAYELIERRTTEPGVANLAVRGKSAANRAALLVRQLLTFGRQETLKPEVLNVAAVMRSADDLLHHALGPAIGRSMDAASGLRDVLADPHQLEIALLNLGVNARDAMPDGGTLAITARNLPAAERPAHLREQDYVAIAVRDTGTGMPPEVRERATEPFFTTKPQGKGTGLGLAMVNDFANQSGGWLRIDCPPDGGTLIELILPRAAVSGTQSTGPGANRHAASRYGNGAIVLLVENDEHVQRIAGGLLRDWGHEVVHASSAEAAAVLAHGMPKLDLLVTEVAMSGATGPELAARLRAERPALPVLYITGQSSQTGLIGEHVLRKPFSGAQLREAMFRRLNGPVDRVASADGKFLRKLQNPGLCASYLAWRAARDGDRLPRLADLEPALLPEANNAFTVAVDECAGPITFRFLRFGPTLAARLGRTLAATPGSGQKEDVGDQALASLDGAYRRCTRTQTPSYEHARCDFGDGEPVTFERLLLPLSEDGRTVTHLTGIVMFTGRTGASLPQ